MKKIIASILFLVTIATTVPLAPLGASGATTAITATTATDPSLIDQKADRIVNTAIDLIGKATYSSTVYKDTYPYQFGCAGFTYFVFKQNGIDMATRSTLRQSLLGEYVPKDQLKKGDLVFFDSNPNDSYPVTHVGIYIGDNKIVHMADPRNNVIISDLDSKSYYRDYYKTARRIIPSYMPTSQLTAGDKIVASAEELMGKVQFGSPYNESTLTFNSPEFIYYIYKMNGFNLPTKMATEMAALGDYVPKDQLQKGDLVFFSTEANSSKISLVAIYTGNSQIIINAGSSTDVVKRLLTNDYYQSHYVTARRILQ